MHSNYRDKSMFIQIVDTYDNKWALDSIEWKRKKHISIKISIIAVDKKLNNIGL